MLRIPATLGLFGAVYLLTTADGSVWRIVFGVLAGAVGVAAFVGGWTASRASRERSLDEAIVRKDEWEQEHGDDPNSSR